jgi:L-alanine-DL-glutamate epimerase-like enolase superfamily enzyme
MRILDIQERTVSLSSPRRNSSIGFGEMTASAVAIFSDVMRDGRPLAGLAFDSVGRYAHGGLLRERFIPRLLAADPKSYVDEATDNLDPHRVWAIAMRNEKPGGHGERPGAVGLIDVAIWDLVAKIAGRPLWSLLLDRFGTRRDDLRVPVYASGGHYRDFDDLAYLRDGIKRSVDRGFTRAKIKFGGLPLVQDIKRVEVAINVLGSGGALAVDCNGVWTRSEAIEVLRVLEPYGLAWIEEPAPPLDYELYRELAASYLVPLGTGENIFSGDDTLNLLRYGGLRPGRDLLQVDVSLSYGIVEYLKILQLIEARGWSRLQCYPHAGNLLAFNVVAGLGLGSHETSPDSFFPLLDVEDGYARPNDALGIGYEASPLFSEVFGDLVQ